jgi:CHASE2 domain-containing sensor protein
MFHLVVKSIFLTVITLLATFATRKLSELSIFRTVFPETIALEEFEITDVAFKNRKDPELNEQIVLINSAPYSRREIAKQLTIVNQQHPRVVAFDQIFNCPMNMQDTLNCPDRRDAKGNEGLARAISSSPNVVLATKLNNIGAANGPGDTVLQSDAEFRTGRVFEGYTNLETEAAHTDGAKTCRQFSPTMSVNGNRYFAFAVQIAKNYDSTRAKEFLERNNFSEIINYRGNTYQLTGTSAYPQAFYVIEGKDLLEGNFLPEMLKDRVVIFGYLGRDADDRSWNDKYYTPLNRTIAGKTNPDMYGTVVQANILAMILERDYVDKLSEANEFVLAFFVCLLHIYLLLIIKEKLPRWFDVLSLLLIFAQLVLYSYMRIFSMQFFSYQLTLIVTLGSLAIASLSINISSGVFEYVKNRRGLLSLRKEKASPIEKVIQ